MKKVLTLLLPAALAVGGCAVQKRLVQTDLYFGLSQEGGKTVSDSAWTAFVQRHVSPLFSSGFTLLSAEGKWVDANDKKLYGEPSRIISSINRMSKDLSAGIDSLRATYKRLFQQQAVLRVDKKVAASF